MAAKRLLLDRNETRVLTDLCGIPLPPGLVTPPDKPLSLNLGDPTPEAGEPTDDDLLQGLIDRGICRRLDGQVVPVQSVLINIAVFARADVSVRVMGRHGTGGLLAWYAARGPVAASAFLREDGGIELSLFPAVELGQELQRSVPEPHTVAGEKAPEGRLPLAALTEIRLPDPAAMGITPLLDSLPADQRALTVALRDTSLGHLEFLVMGRAADATLVAPVLWILTPGGWVGLDEDPLTEAERQAGAGRMMRAVAVDRRQIGVWLAPGIGACLRAKGGAA